MSSINLAGPQAATVALQLVVFSLGEEEYALPITDVQEIIRYSEPRGVASESPWIRGVISLRGKIVPVCDLATRLGLPVDGGRANIVIVETASGTAGVIVDEVQEVLTVDESSLEPLPSAADDVVEGVAKVGDRLVVLLNPNGILAGVARAAAA